MKGLCMSTQAPPLLAADRSPEPPRARPLPPPAAADHVIEVLDEVCDRLLRRP
jgi:hypothetical protein